MNPQKIKCSIEHLSERKVPIFLWGPPGIGKSSIIAQIAKEKEIACIDLRLSLLDPTDLRGIPFMEVSVDDWRVWAINNNIDLSIISFISYRPDALFTFNTQSDTKAFATPRTWQYVNEVLLSTPEDDLIMALISGAIGEELAASFLGFKAVIKELPNMDGILDGSEKESPTDTSALHILCTALAIRVNEDTRTKELDNLINYSLNLPGEFAVMIIQDLRQRKIELDHLKSWPLWMKKFNTLLR